MTFQLSLAIPVLESTPAVLRAMLEGVHESWLRNNYGPDTFCPFDVVGHLIHGDRTDWIPRMKRILEHGELRAFEPFDRDAMYAECRGQGIGELLDTFACVRRENVTALRAARLTDDDLKRTGMHPAIGAVTLRQLLATWVAHDLNHIHQVAKCMAYQYRSEVGPWRTYLGVLAGAPE
jgi:hypothetical protein